MTADKGKSAYGFVRSDSYTLEGRKHWTFHPSSSVPMPNEGSLLAIHQDRVGMKSNGLPKNWFTKKAISD